MQTRFVKLLTAHPTSESFNKPRVTDDDIVVDFYNEYHCGIK